MELVPSSAEAADKNEDSPGRLLARFFSASESGMDDLLSRLLSSGTIGAIRRVVQRRLLAASAEEREDVSSNAVVLLIGRLRALRHQPEGRPAINDFGAYAAGIAAHAVHAHLAAKNPGRSRLRRKLRCVLTVDPRFCLWESNGGTWWCAPASQRERRAATPEDIDECRRHLATRRLPEEMAGVVATAMDRLRRPVELNEFAALLAEATGVDDRMVPADDLEWKLADGEASAAVRLELRDWMRGVWSEIRELPERQRIALLLQMRTPDGPAVALILDLGLARFSELAAALEMTVEELAAIWNRLPLSDLEIGERLGVPRQQVINLRSSARQRLERRLRPD